MKNLKVPDWLKNCPIVFDWITYNGETYFASLNWEASVRKNKPVFDLAYCATKALNNIFLKQRIFNKKMKLKVWTE